MNKFYPQLIGILLVGTVGLGSIGVAGEPEKPKLAERAKMLCDRAADLARIHWEEAADLSEGEFKRILETSRSGAMIGGGTDDEITRALNENGVESDLATELLEYAAAFDDADRVELLIEAGVPVDGNGNSLPPLLAAASCRNHERMAQLLEYGANPNVYYPAYNSAEAMVQAITFLDQSMARLLLDHGYDPCETKLADGRNLAEVIDRRTGLERTDPFWSQLVCD